ncbi:MAG: endonuclease/exonuclease/phosphatase family protein, partial [Nitrospirota bacterium]|nr:endonuclease/exonuclease/phosphatase family protein [Nitrospirota bacterium]
MLIATWNVNSIKSRLPHVGAYLKEVSPDVLLLQELKSQEENVP